MATSSFKNDCAMADTAVLLINTGSPDAPEADAVRRYLAEFLSDPRIVELPRWQWMPILHGIILRTRPAKSAKRYQGVWTDRGSPLIVHCSDIAQKLGNALGGKVIVRAAMRYGNPSVASVIDELCAAGVRKILLFPMFAQYASQTSAACLDAAFSHFSSLRCIPAVRTIRGYHDAPEYIDALASTVRAIGQKPDVRKKAAGERFSVFTVFRRRAPRSVIHTKPSAARARCCWLQPWGSRPTSGDFPSRAALGVTSGSSLHDRYGARLG